MASQEKRPLKVFLCHASGDKPPVRDLYRRMVAEGVDAWLDQEKLLPGQDWRMEIPRAVQESDVVVVCLSNKSITKEGYVQKEIKFALDIAEEKPEGAIFLIPARLEDCVVPERLSRWQWVDLYEENGFLRLLRSLKLRAAAVGALIEAAPYEDTDQERKRRIDQLYTEGLAAFYTEDWDRACRRFQAILSEQPNHKNASEKLEEAQCQRQYADLYTQATEAYRSENWPVAISALDELTQRSPQYKDAMQLLREVRKREQLTELYTEARALHAAQQWKAVVRVFEQIAMIEPNYPDADGLLASAQKEVAELERIAGLDEHYSQALREMDAGNWVDARRLLENVHKSQTGFLETEKLLRKVENEILKEEEKRRQNDQINILYEQAHGLLRSKKWRNALSKLEEIRKLDGHFQDVEGIVEKARHELEREEQEAKRQDKLAALYAESVRLLKEEKYQEALDKWHEVREFDPRYPDRQWVQRTARKNLTKQAKLAPAVSRFTMTRSMWLGLSGAVVLALLGFGIYRLRDGGTGTFFSDISTEPALVNPPGLPAELQIRVNYGHDWVESFYMAGHEIVITVTDQDGGEKAITTVFTEPRGEWGGEPGFQTTPEGWAPSQPDLQPYDWVRVRVDNGQTAEVQLGDIRGEVHIEQDSITGSIETPWISNPVSVKCLDWGSQENHNEREGGLVFTNGTEPYTCSWKGEWDVQPWQDIGVSYSTPEGHWIANTFHDERWMAVWTYELDSGFWSEGEHSYYFQWDYATPDLEDGRIMNPLTLIVSKTDDAGEIPIYPGYVLFRALSSATQVAWTGSSCDVVPSIHPDQATRFVWIVATDNSMTYEDTLDQLHGSIIEAAWDNEPGDLIQLEMREILPYMEVDALQSYLCQLTEHP